MPDVADAHVVLQHTDRAQILPEWRIAEVLTQLLGPGREMLRWVGVDGFIRPTVNVEIRLAVAGEIEP